jgi:hypothetical protein
MKNVSLILMLWLGIIGPVAVTQAQPCDCTSNFDYLVTKVKTNYIGYADKVTAANQQSFDRFTDSLRQESRHVKPAHCIAILLNWINFFDDSHLVVFLDDSPDNAAEIQALLTGLEKIDKPEAEIRAYLDQNKKNLHPIEGIWDDELKDYQIAIIKDKTGARDYVGFVLKSHSRLWQPGHVKMDIRKTGKNYTAAYYNRYHIPIETSLKLTASKLEVVEYAGWTKTYPVTSANRTVVRTVVAENREDEDKPQFKKLDEETCLLIVPSFNLAYKPAVDSLLRHNRNTLLCTPNLIIDVRSNWGGNNATFDEILPFLYTQPILTQPYSVLATEDNIALYQQQLAGPNLSQEQKESLQESIRLLTQHKNERVQIYPVDTITLDSVYAYPARVGVLMNKWSASSTEFFLQRARQSSKVTLFGEPSLGGIDYTHYLRNLPLPCKIYQYHYPMARLDSLDVTKSSRVKPDIILTEDKAQWLEVVRSQLKKKLYSK